jgi:hypothetical protein
MAITQKEQTRIMKTLLRYCGYDQDEYYSQCVQNPYGGYPDWDELEAQQALDDPDCEYEETA